MSAGAIGTVQILQLSGIGDPADLNPLGIDAIVNSPRVGKNLQDHPLLPNVFTVVEGGSLDHILRKESAMGEAINEWAVNRTGFISNNVVNNLAFARVKPEVLEGHIDPAAGKLSPHYELIFAVRSISHNDLTLTDIKLHIRTIGLILQIPPLQQVATSPYSLPSLRQHLVSYSSYYSQKFT